VNSPNGNAPAGDRGVRLNSSSATNPQPRSAFKTNLRGRDEEEQRRNSAACFKNPNKREEWHADFIGVLVAEDLPTGSKVWINVPQKIDKKGRPFLSVSLRPRPSKGKS